MKSLRKLFKQMLDLKDKNLLLFGDKKWNKEIIICPNQVQHNLLLKITNF
jgi:hypothetical protein